MDEQIITCQEMPVLPSTSGAVIIIVSETLVWCSSPSRLISAVTTAVLKSRLRLPPTPVREQECPECH